MKKLLSLPTLAVALVFTTSASTWAADIETTPTQNAESADYIAGKVAVEKKDWATAMKQFELAVVKDPKNADAWNMLGYSSRWAGKYPEAFDAYGKALALDPKHRGANSYLGVAYVRTHDLAKARTQLAKVETICGNKDCDEYKLLNKAIAEYKPK